MSHVDDWLSKKLFAITKRAQAERAEAEAAAILMRHQACAEPSEPVKAGDGKVKCDKCGAEIKATKREDGTTWTPEEKAEYSRKKNGGKVLCYKCQK